MKPRPRRAKLRSRATVPLPATPPEMRCTLTSRQPVAEAAAALVGREVDGKAALQQRVRQRFRRKHVAAGAAGQ
jgi:hypothetical protein